MRRRVVLPLLAVAATGVALAISAPASAHGYVSSPPSRQAMCAAGRVANCGEIIYEPQSVEGPKGLTSCSGGNARFAELDDESKNWPATQVGNTVSFTWHFTARHATLDFEYWIGNTKIASFPGHSQQPTEGLTHTVNLGGRTGRIKVLAIWNISDTANAFYSCVDLQVGGGGGNPTPPTSPSPTRSPSPSPSPTHSTSPSPSQSPTQNPPSGTWTAGTAYNVGDVVTYDGASFKCIQAHTALPGWEPPNVPALWQRL